MSEKMPCRYFLWLRKTCGLAVLLFVSCHGERAGRKLDLPGAMLWAWERPENLEFLAKKPVGTGVAFLAGTAVIGASGVVQFRMRTQDLLLPPGVPLLSVVRIESPAVHGRMDMTTLLAGLQTAAQLPGVRGLQIDFDARLSERASYRGLLNSIRQRTNQPVGITALVSWCDGDSWIDDAPVDEAVPMFFRLGRGESRDQRIRSAVCRSSIGLSTDEAWPTRRPDGLKRIYLFSPTPWTEQDYTHAMHRIASWK